MAAAPSVGLESGDESAGAGRGGAVAALFPQEGALSRGPLGRGAIADFCGASVVRDPGVSFGLLGCLSFPLR